jgi:membrane protease YdiL (CAAX protease family)
MFIGSWFLGKMTTNPDYFEWFRGSVLPGFFEEWLFRGFLFGIVFRKAGWGFIPASLIGSFFFGLAHIYQGSEVLESVFIFLITGMGAAWFAWLYVEWDFNLWVPIFFHTLMNLSWILFEVSENALGGLGANVFRAITIALSVIITVKIAKKKGFNVNKNNLFKNELVQ